MECPEDSLEKERSIMVLGEHILPLIVETVIPGLVPSETQSRNLLEAGETREPRLNGTASVSKDNLVSNDEPTVAAPSSPNPYIDAQILSLLWSSEARQNLRSSTRGRRSRIPF